MVGRVAIGNSMVMAMDEDVILCSCVHIAVFGVRVLTHATTATTWKQRLVEQHRRTDTQAHPRRHHANIRRTDIGGIASYRISTDRHREPNTKK